MSVYRRAAQLLPAVLGQTMLGLVLSLCAIGLNLLKPWPFKVIVDDVLTPTDGGRLALGSFPCSALRWSESSSPGAC